MVFKLVINHLNIVDDVIRKSFGYKVVAKKSQLDRIFDGESWNKRSTDVTVVLEGPFLFFYSHKRPGKLGIRVFNCCVRSLGGTRVYACKNKLD